MVLARFRGWLRGWRLALLSGTALLLLGGSWWWRYGQRFYVRWLLESPLAGECQKRLTRATLKRSLDLGTRFLLAHQKPAGNFDYEYDWRSRTLSQGDQETRQAGALWGLALLYADRKTPELQAAVERGLHFFDEHSRATGSLRCTVYPGSRSGRTGTVALVALAYIEYLRAADQLSLVDREDKQRRLDEYLAMLLASMDDSKLWHADYDLKRCRARGEPSSYSDGEALLALVKAAKYLGRRQLIPTILGAAQAGKELNIERALEEDPNSDVTKGYYQWSSMAFYELSTSGFAEAEPYAKAVFDLADWVIDVHAILTRSRNTGYAYEGIVHAYKLAKSYGDRARVAKYGCVIDVGLEHIMSWQVGGPVPNRFTADVSPSDKLALGGVQNEAFEPALRIDVTQHQMHATQLALEYVY